MKNITVGLLVATMIAVSANKAMAFCIWFCGDDCSPYWWCW